MRPTIRHEFVDAIPDRLDDGVLYISIEYATAVHACLCGCGHEVVTPLAPKQWSMTFDGESVSLKPSVGNWSFPCQSHYWIVNNKVHAARRFTRDEIDLLRTEDRELLRSTHDNAPTEEKTPSLSVWQRTKALLSRWMSVVLRR